MSNKRIEEWRDRAIELTAIQGGLTHDNVATIIKEIPDDAVIRFTNSNGLHMNLMETQELLKEYNDESLNIIFDFSELAVVKYLRRYLRNVDEKRVEMRVTKWHNKAWGIFVIPKENLGLAEKVTHKTGLKLTDNTPLMMFASFVSQMMSDNPRKPVLPERAICSIEWFPISENTKMLEKGNVITPGIYDATQIISPEQFKLIELLG